MNTRNLWLKRATRRVPLRPSAQRSQTRLRRGLWPFFLGLSLWLAGCQNGAPEWTWPPFQLPEVAWLPDWSLPWRGEAEADVTLGTTTIRVLGWAGSEAENRQLQESILAFEASHAPLTVDGLLMPDYGPALEEALRSPTPPDVFLAWSHQLGDLVAAQAILPIPPAYSVGEDIAANLVDGLQVAGQPYCFPREIVTLALFYNPALFDRAGIGYPTADWTWNELQTAAEATTDSDFGLYGLALTPDISRLHTFLLQAATDADLWQGADALAATQYYVELYSSGVAVEPLLLDSTWNGEAFGRGRAAMTLEGTWLPPYLAAEFPNLDYGLVELPAGPARRGGTAYITCWVVNRVAANPEAALELAAFLSSPAITSSWADASGNLPPTLAQATVWAERQPALAPFATGLAYASPWHGPAGFVAQTQLANSLLHQVLEDEATLEELQTALAELSTLTATPTLLPTATPTFTVAPPATP